jgi:autotransporter beta-domain protein
MILIVKDFITAKKIRKINKKGEEMTNNLRRFSQDLRAFAKRTKDFKYTESALITFLITGMIFSAGKLDAAPKEPTIESQRRSISTSITDMRQNFKRVKAETKKLIKDSNMELIQLMEQGDHVTKSPWSSWQFGQNFFYDDWHGVYKGRGDKKTKYPYEGIFERGDRYERAINPLSDKYEEMPLASRKNAASSSQRTGLVSDSYGLVGVKPLLEPTVGFNVSVAIRPKQVVKGAITIADKTPATPAQPETIIFNAPNISVTAPAAPQVEPAQVTISSLTVTPPTLPSITLPTPLSFTPASPTVNVSIPTPNSLPTLNFTATGNGDESYMLGGGPGTWTYTKGASYYAPSDRAAVALMGQVSMSSGTVSYTDSGITINGNLTGSGSMGGSWSFSGTHSVTGFTGHALIKNTGDYTSNIDNTTITFNRSGGANYDAWLFHTDAHNSSVVSAFVLGSGTTINTTGNKSVVYTSQFHNGNLNAEFTNNGTIDMGGTENIVWVALNENARSRHKDNIFRNGGTIKLNSSKNTFAYIDMPTTIGAIGGGWAGKGVPAGGSAGGTNAGNSNGWEIISTGTLDIGGTQNTGIFINDSWKYWKAKIELAAGDKTKISGTKNIGTYFKGWADVSTSKLNMQMPGDENVGIYLEYAGTATDDEFKFTSASTLDSEGKKNVLIYNKASKANFGTNVNLKVNGKENVGIVNESAQDLVTAAKIETTKNSGEESIGIYSKGTGATTNTGNITMKAKKVKGIVADNSGTINNNGGTIAVEGDEVAGAIAMGNGTVNISTALPSNATTITVKGKSGLGLYAESGGTINAGDATITSSGGAVNVYSNGGDIHLSKNNKKTTVNVGADSLGFMRTGGKQIIFDSAAELNVATGGSGFYITTSPVPTTVSYPVNIAAELSGGYSGLNKLTANMSADSNLVVASYAQANLSDLDLSSQGMTINGTGYKEFLLYRSKLTLDSPKTYDDYKKIALSSSSIINDTAIQTDDDGVKLMAQENDGGTNKWVTLENKKTIELGGKNSVAMYASDGTIKNHSGATITMKKEGSAAIFGKNTGKGDTEIINDGNIQIGEKSVGLFAEDYTEKNLENAGKIAIVGDSGIGMYYKAGTLTQDVTMENKTGAEISGTELGGTTPAASVKRVGMYSEANSSSKKLTAKNSGDIKILGDGASSIGDANIAMYTNATAAGTNPLENAGTIELGKYGIGMYGWDLDTSGDITVGDGGVAIYSQGGDVNMAASGTKKIKVGKDARGILVVGDGQNVTATNYEYEIGDGSYGFVNRNSGPTGNTFTISGGKATLGNKGKFIYSSDKKGNITNSTDMEMLSTATDGENYGIYATGTVINSGKIEFTKGKGNVGIYATEDGDITNSGNIELGESDAANKKYSIGIIAKPGKVTNSGTVKIGDSANSIDGKDGIGLFADSENGKNGEIINTGAITTEGDSTIGAYANASSKISLGAGGDITVKGDKTTGYYIDQGTGSSIASGVSIDVTGDNANGVFVNKGGLTYEGDTTVTGDGAYGFVAGKNSSVTANGGSVTVSGASGSSKATTGTDGRGTAGVVALAGANLTGGKMNVDADVTDEGSVGIYSAGKIEIDKADIKAYNGAVNFFADNGGTISVGNNGGSSTVVTGTGTDKGSLLFYTPGGKVLINGPMTATIEGGTKATTRGTAFYYTGGGTLGNIASYTALTPGNVAAWARTNYGDGTTSTLGNLTLNMQADSRLFLTQKVNMNLSNTSVSNLFSGLASTEKPTVGGSNDYRRFMLYQSHLNVDQAVNLDNPSDDYNLLEISNSSITNNSTITGTQDGQIGIAQENSDLATPKSTVTLINKGTIDLSGKNSAAIYGKNAIVVNDTAGIIKIAKSSTGLYGLRNTEIYNKGNISVGNKSTGMFYSDVFTDPVTSALTIYDTETGLQNTGTITLDDEEGVGMTYEPGNITVAPVFENAGTITSTKDKNVGMYAKVAKNNISYDTVNSKVITFGDSASLADPNVAMYTNATGTGTNPLINNGDITIGKNAVGIYGFEEVNNKNITVGDGSVAMYSKGGNVDLNSGTIKVGKNEAVGVYTVGSGQQITNTGTAFDIGDTSFGFVNVGTGNTIESNISDVILKNDSVYAYSNDTSGIIRNNTNLTSVGTNGNNYGIYAAGTIENNGNIDFNTGIGNVGVYSVKNGNARNTGTISVGGSDPINKIFSVGMAAGYIGDSSTPATTGNIENNGTINVNGKYSIGMYGVGAGTTVTNNSDIVLNANNTIGIYVEEGAKAINNGSIRTGASGLSSVTGVVLSKNSTLDNRGTIDIDSRSGVGVYLKGGTIINRGRINVTGKGAVEEYDMAKNATSKPMGDVIIDAPAGSPTAKIIVAGKGEVQPTLVTTTAENPITVSASSIGLYVDTSSKNYTQAIDNLGALTGEADLIIGVEAAENTASKYIQINDRNILDPYNRAIVYGGVAKWTVYSGALTWMATPTLDPDTGEITNLYMAKAAYTNWASNSKVTPTKVTDTYNFADGLEQRYGVKPLGTRENQIFQKLNSIGNNEEILLYQAFDEMMGHQYGNLQQRISKTGSLLDKEFNHLRKDWRKPSKDNNKIKVFGMRDEYNSDTAGVIDNTSNAYGFAYVHENDTVKLGNSSGWYAGAVTNRFRFKDIGHSKENQSMIKAGVFKTMSPKNDHNGSLRWTISGDVYAGINDMKRRYLVVDEVFEAKSDYRTYGAAVKNELGYNIRMSERTHLRPYGALKMEYGRFNNIKEDRGEMRLEVKGNDYFSVKPEVGMEFRYVQPLAVRTNLSVGLTAAYENELGKVGENNNKARVRYTSADWFGIRGEKDDRKGSGKFDLNIGIDNTRFGVTVNAGYDTKGKNVRGGIGFRAIY